MANDTLPTPTPVDIGSLIRALDLENMREPEGWMAEASLAIGYSWPLENHNHRVAVIESNSETRIFFHFLLDNEIDLYDPKEVDAYKKAMIQQRVRQARERRYGRYNWRCILITIVHFVAITATARLLLSSWEHVGLMYVLAWIVSPCLLLVPYCDEARYEWQSIDIAKYKKEVPSDLVIAAMMIKKAFMGVSVFVDELQEIVDEEVSNFFLDPFLCVTFKGENYYIGRWDEPTFRPTKTTSEVVEELAKGN
jgi:hypothetical protein